VTDPGGNVARSNSPSVTSGRNWRRTRETKCHTPAWAWTSGVTDAEIEP
jgi:hypothetical protein